MPTTPRHKGTPVATAIRAYFAALSPPARRRMQQIRAIIRAAAPGATEHFSYGIPAFKLEGQPLVWYGAFRHHSSLYPITESLARAHRIDLSGYETAKGTVRFSLDAPLPTALVKRLVKARAAESKKTGR
jgi:uncharacterized protein YdhG (YjbR/CyaY superfamily)